MANEGTQANRIVKAQIFEVEGSLPIPPGTKSRAKLWRGVGPEPLPRRVWWLLGSTAVVALLVGVVIGRFLLP
jgi:hypothetical protein